MAHGRDPFLLVTAYGVWVGIGSVGTVILGIVLIVAGIVGLKLSA